MIPANIYLYDISILNPEVTDQDRKTIDAIEKAKCCLDLSIVCFAMVYQIGTTRYQSTEHMIEYLLKINQDMLQSIAIKYPIPTTRVFNRMTMNGIWWSGSDWNLKPWPEQGWPAE